MPSQHRFDLSQLDAKATDLYLFVLPPEVLNIAIQVDSGSGRLSGRAGLRARH